MANMASDTQEPNKPRPLVGSDLIIPIAAIALALYYFTTIIESPWTAQVTAFVVGITLILLSAVYIVRALSEVMRGAAQLTFRDLVEPTALLPVRIALFVFTVSSLFLMPRLGFTLTSILFLSGAILLLTRAREPIRVLVLSVSLSILWFVVFVLIFQRRFPLGWLDEQIKAVVLPVLRALGLGQ